MNQQHLGKAIKIERKQQGLTQQALASRASVSLATLQNIELGRANPELATLSSLAETLGLEIELRPKGISWNSLAALGVPLLSKDGMGVVGRRELVFQLNRMVPLLNTILKDTREADALAGFLLALKGHYASVWSEIAPVWSGWLASIPVTERVVKLRRLALEKLGRYL